MRGPSHFQPYLASALLPKRAAMSRSRECPMTGQYEEATISRIRHLRVAAPPAPRALNRTVPPRRLSNASLRSREHLTPDEVEQLITAARQRGRYGTGTQPCSCSPFATASASAS